MNETKKKERGLEVKVGELILVLLRRWWLIALCGIITASAFWISTKLFVTPVYQSVTKIFVLSQQEGNYLTTTDIQLSSYLTKDYAELIKSRTAYRATTMVPERYSNLISGIIGIGKGQEIIYRSSSFVYLISQLLSIHWKNFRKE